MKGHTQRQWEVKFFTSGCKCVYCETPLTLASASKDHMIPTSRGGSDDICNIVPACFPCNHIKNNRTFEEFMRDRPSFSKVALKSTVIGKPIEQARALLSIGVPVQEKPKPLPVKQEVAPPRDPNRRMSLAMRDEVPLWKLRKENEATSWAWRNRP